MKNSDWQKEVMAEEENIHIPVDKNVKNEVRVEEKEKNVKDQHWWIFADNVWTWSNCQTDSCSYYERNSSNRITCCNRRVTGRGCAKPFFNCKEATAMAEETLDGSKRYLGLPETEVKLAEDPNQSFKQQHQMNYMKSTELTERKPNLHPVDEVFIVVSAIIRELFLSYDTISHNEIIYSPVPFYIKQVLGCDASRDSVSISYTSTSLLASLATMFWKHLNVCLKLPRALKGSNNFVIQHFNSDGFQNEKQTFISNIHSRALKIFNKLLLYNCM